MGIFQEGISKKKYSSYLASTYFSQFSADFETNPKSSYKIGFGSLEERAMKTDTNDLFTYMVYFPNPPTVPPSLTNIFNT